MNKIPYHNDSDSLVTVGTVHIRPGETRDVDASLLANTQQPAEAIDSLDQSTDPNAEYIADLLNGKVASVVETLGEIDDTALLIDISKAEEAGQDRKGVQQAIQERLMSIAADDIGAEA